MMSGTVRVNNCPGFFFNRKLSILVVDSSIRRTERETDCDVTAFTDLFSTLHLKERSSEYPSFRKKKRKDPVVEGYSLELLVKVTYVASN